MDTEFEAKFYPVDKEAYRKKLTSLRAKLLVPERKMRRSIVDKRFNPSFLCDYIRVRDEGNTVTMSAKTHAGEDGKLSDQKETVITVSNYDKAVEILLAMGFKLDSYQENLRETWELEGAEIVIDTWPGLEPYTEIEAESEEKVKKISEKLGFKWQEKIITSVVEIYGRIYGLTNEKVHDRITNLTFKNNRFIDEK